MGLLFHVHTEEGPVLSLRLDRLWQQPQPRPSRKIVRGVPFRDADPTKSQRKVLLAGMELDLSAMPDHPARREALQKLSALRGDYPPQLLADFVGVVATRPGIPVLKRRGPVPEKTKAVDAFFESLSPIERLASDRALTRRFLQEGGSGDERNIRRRIGNLKRSDQAKESPPTRR